ncbi:hypothetical protein [Verrucosispora sp. WMMD1129]|uniref:hypothetical protein n=1 Tax=Verrucosispora sp. WMMD1129 TaxID=3016093 RepID=UPI00249B30E2|nr:hypothetical protein [Verrucosispora sp. WMMD1129]WFE47571.1 hypothetical protein O7624_26245 [Verrucosispora sp. WMMD1129]
MPTGSAGEGVITRVRQTYFAMGADESRPEIRRSRAVEKKELPAGPLRDLRDAVYVLYVEADRPRLDELVRQIADDDDLPGAPKKDLIGKIIAGDGLASQQDTATVAVALARAAGRESAATVAEQVRQLWIAAASADPVEPPVRIGRPVAECDPLTLEVHRAIELTDVATTGLDLLPGYVPRVHDTRLRQVVDELLAGGRSRLVTLVGESSTGKTRACWELVRYLDGQDPGRWRVWHPYDPTRPQAALAELEKVGPETVVWLNEAQHYLMPADPKLAERIAAGLRSLLQDPGRGPVLVLATLWQEYWNTLTTSPAGGVFDVYAQARELLTGTARNLPDAFTPTEAAAQRGSSVDPRLRYAVERAENGRITQYLAGAPALEDRYRTAPPAARAVLQAAMDARRLGHPLALPHALLERAAPGYLDDHDWDTCGEDWLEQALAYTAAPCTGARGPLTRIRPRSEHPTPDAPAVPDDQPCYRLADYLEQLGRTERAGIYPPDTLWQAFSTTITEPELLTALGVEAGRRGRYQHVIWLYTQAADHGDTHALQNLAELRDKAGDTASTEALAIKAADHGMTIALRDLAGLREGAGDTAGAEALYRHAADHGNALSLRLQAGLREETGDPAGAEALAIKAAGHGDTGALWLLAGLREEAGDRAGAETLAIKAADHGNTDALWHLAGLREEAGDRAGAEALYRHAADHGDTDAMWHLAGLREEAGDAAGAETLAIKAADHGNTGALRFLAGLREEAGDTAGAEALYRQAADHGNTDALRDLIKLREETGGHADAGRMRRFGLTGAGEANTALDFGSYGGLVSE